MLLWHFCEWDTALSTNFRRSCIGKIWMAIIEREDYSRKKEQCKQRPRDRKISVWECWASGFGAAEGVEENIEWCCITNDLE